MALKGSKTYWLRNEFGTISTDCSVIRISPQVKELITEFKQHEQAKYGISISYNVAIGLLAKQYLEYLNSCTKLKRIQNITFE